MSWFALISLEIRHAWRSAVPSLMVRLGLFAAALALEGALLFLVLRQPLAIRHSLHLGFLVGLGCMNLLLAVGAAGFALAQLLARPQPFTAVRLSPLSPGLALQLPLAPSVLAALAPLTLLGLPFILGASRGYPLLALAIAVVVMCALGWSVVVAMVLAIGLVRRAGSERGAQLLRVLSGALAVVALLSFRWLVGLQADKFLSAAFLVATPLLLPPCWTLATRSLLQVLEVSEAPHTSPEPRWGRLDSWRQLGRAVSFPVALVLVPALWLSASAPALRPALVGLLALLLGMAPLQRLLEPEFARPERLLLAPRGAAFRFSLVVHWGAVGVVVGTILCALFGWGRWEWVSGIGALLLLMPFTFLLESPRLRFVGQSVLLAIGVCLSALWGSESLVALRG